MTTKIDLSLLVTERDASALDDGFFRRVFVADRLPDFLGALPREQAEALAVDQYRLQTIGYAEAYPHASHRVIEWRGHPVGRVIDADQGAYVLVVDLVLDPDSRGLGIGTEIMGRVQARAAVAQQPVRLSAVIGSPAVRLHESLGFRHLGVVGDRHEMEWTL